MSLRGCWWDLVRRSTLVVIIMGLSTGAIWGYEVNFKVN